MAQLFVSYARDDREQIDKLAARLSARGHWVRVDVLLLRGGDRWRERLHGVLRGVDAMIVALSAKSVRSAEVRWEIDIARGFKVPIVPVVVSRIESLGILGDTLAGLHRLNLASGSDQGCEDLMLAVASISERAGLDPHAEHPLERAGLDDILADPDLRTREKMDLWIERYRRNQETLPHGRRQAELAQRIADIDSRIETIYAYVAGGTDNDLHPGFHPREDELSKTDRAELESLRTRRRALAAELSTLELESFTTGSARAIRGVEDFGRRVDRIERRITGRTEDDST